MSRAPRVFPSFRLGARFSLGPEWTPAASELLIEHLTARATRRVVCSRGSPRHVASMSGAPWWLPLDRRSSIGIGIGIGSSASRSNARDREAVTVSRATGFLAIYARRRDDEIGRLAGAAIYDC